MPNDRGHVIPLFSRFQIIHLIGSITTSHLLQLARSRSGKLPAFSPDAVHTGTLHPWP